MDIHRLVADIQSQRGWSLGHDRMFRLLDALDHPEQDLKGIHVAGTNGKGSTCAMLFAMLNASGQPVGMYTSPHLVSYAERFRLGDGFGAVENLTEEAFTQYVERIWEKVQEWASDDTPTWFELLTAVALCYFRDQGAVWVIMEVGLGGRLDATNIKDWEYKVITSIGLDHTEVLGDSLPKIAAEKAGIVPVPSRAKQLITSARPPARQVILDRCAAANLPAQVTEAACDGLSWRGCSFHFSDTAQKWQTPLLGMHQPENAAVAVAVALAMRRDGELRLSNEQIQAALYTTNWPGRLESVKEPDWPKQQGKLLLDGAHNEDGIKALVDSLQQLAPSSLGSVRRVVYAAKLDKDVGKILPVLEEWADEFSFVPIHPAVPCHQPQDLARLVNCPAHTAQDVASAIARVASLASEADVTVICGSLYLIGEAHKSLYNTKLWSLDEMHYNFDALRGATPKP